MGSRIKVDLNNYIMVNDVLYRRWHLLFSNVTPRPSGYRTILKMVGEIYRNIPGL
jgi:hypothetical protein